MKNIYKTIRQGAQLRGPEQVALEDGSAVLTYPELVRCVDGLADFLGQCGVGAYCRVALFCGDSIDYVTASLSVLALQAVVVPVPPTSAPHELEELLERIGADFLLFDKTLCKREGGFDVPVQNLVEKQFHLLHLEAPSLPAGFAELNPAFVRFSSGTTGQSKGVLLSHEAIHERTDAADKGLGITADDTVLWVLSMSYHFVVSILLFLRRGATICLCYNDFPLALHDAIAQSKGTFIYAAPFHYYAMARSSAFAPDCMHRIRMAISTSMKLQEEIARGFVDKFGLGLAEAYGIIEVGLPFINLAPGKVLGSVGRILPDYQMKLEDADGAGMGEIWIRGKGMFNAYVSPWHVIGKDEWFRTGDLGRIDEQGNLYIVGRKKGLINFMGMKVFPEEIEEVLDAHPGVAESLVYGRPHPHYGQLPCARVVRTGDVEKEALVAHCLRELSPHMVPKAIEFVKNLPRTPSGKLCRDGEESLNERRSQNGPTGMD